jgi:protocatechuate 3,4-dioxygenase beta subunit
MTRITSSLSRLAIALAVCLVTAASTSAQVVGVPSQSQQAQAPPATGTAVLRGHVYDADGGRPLRGSIVRIRALAPNAPNRTATTDPQGAWEFTELPAGEYLVNVSKNNYVSLAHGQRRPGDQSLPIAVADGQTIEKLDIALPKGGVITGHVVDEYGDPVPNVVVNLLNPRYVQGRRRVSGGEGIATTDDLGEYRLFGVPPSSYYVGATYRTPPAAAGDDDAPGYAVTFFPGVVSTAGAQRVTVGFGESHDEVNIALVPVKTAKVSGTAVKSTGEPMTGGFVRMIASDVDMFGGPGGQIQNDGTFVIRSVPPGEYRLQASAPGGPNRPPEIAQATVSVAGQDVAGVQLTAPAQATLSGSILIDPAAASTTKAGTINIQALMNDFTRMSMTTARAADDFTFQMALTPGPIVLSVNGLGRSMAVHSIRLNGTDVTDRGFDLKPGQNVTGIEIELTSQPTVVSGQVTDGRGANAAGATVLVFARDEAKWEGSTRYVKFTRSDQDGKFNLPGLPQGDYYAIALDAPNVNEISDPELLVRFRDHATLLSLSDGETKVLDLRITPGL